MKIWSNVLLAAASLALLVPTLSAQAVYTAETKSSFQAGAGYLILNNDYTTHYNEGITVYGDYDYNHFIGAEVDLHFGGINTPDDIGENSYLVGPRVSYHRYGGDIYGKILFGRGTITNQDYNTSSSFNVYAFGGGVEYRVKRHYNIRLIDLEEEKWPNFEPHTLSPIAITIGAAYVIH